MVSSTTSGEVGGTDFHRGRVRGGGVHWSLLSRMEGPACVGLREDKCVGVRADGLTTKWICVRMDTRESLCLRG